MASELPYLPSCKNVEKLFEKIKDAKLPGAFNHKFLYETIGLKGIGDRPLIPFLKSLGFLDTSNKPTADYAALKNELQAPRALALAVRRAYGPLFDANQNAHKLSADQLKGLISQVAGSDAGTTTKILGTVNSLIKLGDFSTDPAKPPAEPPKTEEEDKTADVDIEKLRPQFHYNIQVHLPSNSTEETYLNIFNALRKAFK